MIFSSPLFLFLFLPLVLSFYLISPSFLKNFILLTASLIFYCWGEIMYSYVMLLSIIFNWGFALLIAKTNSADAKKIILWFAVTLNVGFLVYFKYATFIASSVGYDFEDSIPLPLGISFFTFHALSYVIDVYRGISLTQKSIINLGLYISNFPQLIAGPIIRYPDVGSQL